MFKHLLFAIFTAQVVWGQGGNKVIGDCCAKVLLGHADINIHVGFWERVPDAVVNARPVYQIKSYWSELYLKYIEIAGNTTAGAPTSGWYIAADKTALTALAPTVKVFAFNDGNKTCIEEADPVKWLFSNDGDEEPSLFADLAPTEYTVRCSDCADPKLKTEPECADCGICPRIKVENVTDGNLTADGYYVPAIGLSQDERPVYKNIGSDVFLISQGGVWQFTSNYTTYVAPFIDMADDPLEQCADKIKMTTNTAGVVRCSDCSANSTIPIEECATPCEPCKEVMEGTLIGLYTLNASLDARCINGCVYNNKDDVKFCFKEGGPLVKQGC